MNEVIKRDAGLPLVDGNLAVTMLSYLKRCEGRIYLSSKSSRCCSKL